MWSVQHPPNRAVRLDGKMKRLLPTPTKNCGCAHGLYLLTINVVTLFFTCLNIKFLFLSFPFVQQMACVVVGDWFFSLASFKQHSYPCNR